MLPIAIGALQCAPPALAEAASQAAATAAAVPAQELDRLLAPIALYPDQLLAQILLCAMEPASVTSLDKFLKAHATLKGTDLQDAVLKEKFEPSFVALALFPQTVTLMAGQIDRTTRVGQAFATDKTAVFASIQRLRKQAKDAGNLKTTPQQAVETQTTSTGQQVIVIEPANPQVVYVPQYNAQTVYVQPAPTTVVVQQSSSSADAAVAGIIGFTAGIAIGAAVNNNYYYGPYGWHGGGYMYNDTWDDYVDHREDAREDWQDHREDLADERSDRAGDAQEQRTERQENRPDSQQQRTERQQGRSDTQSQGRAQTASPSASTATRGSGSSDAFSGYSSGKSERAASSRGNSSRQSSSRSRSGGGRRR